MLIVSLRKSKGGKNIAMWSILPLIASSWKLQDLTSLFYVILQENPGKEEYKAATTILKTQTELLQVGTLYMYHECQTSY